MSILLYRTFSGAKKKSNTQVQWTSWNSLCEPKIKGGLEFRNLKDFNMALLAKQSWHIIDNPYALLARILKVKYFLHGSFMQTREGHNPSWAREVFFGEDKSLTEEFP